ncbi:YqcC family protein [Pleionea mediterranea]|jgi:uncharacterized protein YqcC (DUF446 family)|uniref:Uncharacterized protein YqcC (DUF446 family) n=1 Tax=Pleionea mediterranea TaxID=523701 RepID=A0A316FK13_9GAMM|nr:YqcC family protein [Pleionea mediterranea]PWK49248.1 uncharacterized protein YqcC (DUF446 family) [Pleionea mediterranea]
MSQIHQELMSFIDELSSTMRQLNLWAEQPPEEYCFESTAPFCADTMAFEQWLQFVFIPRLQMLAEQQGTLPAPANILPMAEQVFKMDYQTKKPLLLLMAYFDRLSKRLVNVK